MDYNLISQLNLKSHVCTLATLLVGCSLSHLAWADFYRYYDAKGKPTVSTSVSDNHIKYGYEVLSDQMFVKSRVPPSSHAIETRQQKEIRENKKLQAELNQLRASYGSSSAATRKRDEVLRQLNENLKFNNGKYQQLLAENRALTAQKNSYTKQGGTPPAHLTDKINENNRAIQNLSHNIVVLKDQIHHTTLEYQQVIQRLRSYGY